jgi:hypothetical protein
VDATFEVIRFAVAPAGAGVAVIELEGRPGDPHALDGRPALLLEGAEEHLEVAPVGTAAGLADGMLQVSFAAPLGIATDPATRFALALGRGPLVERPAPDGGGPGSLEVRLAQTVAALREELANARSRLGSEVGQARIAARELAAEKEGAVEERERVEAELRELREEAEELRGELINAQARIDQLESDAELHRVPRTRRHPPPQRRPHPRPQREVLEQPTGSHEHLARTTHRSLGRSVAIAAALVVLALVLAVIIVVVLDVRPV